MFMCSFNTDLFTSAAPFLWLLPLSKNAGPVMRWFCVHWFISVHYRLKAAVKGKLLSVFVSGGHGRFVTLTTVVLTVKATGDDFVMKHA
jgi:hypothetical protein